MPSMKDRALAELALREAAIPAEKIEAALAAQREMDKYKISKPLGALLAEKGMASKEQVAKLLELAISCNVRCASCGRTTSLGEADRNGNLKCRHCTTRIDYPDGRIGEDDLSPTSRPSPPRTREAKAPAGPRREVPQPAAAPAAETRAPRARSTDGTEETGTPRDIGRFKCLELLGVSPAGKLYAVKNGEERLCLKVIDRALCTDKSQQKKWVDQIQLLQDVPKPVTPHGAQLHKEGTTTYVVRTFVGDEPSTLLSRTAALKAAPDPAQARALAEKLLTSLAAFHSAHRVHGNLKPGNVLFTPQGAVLLDPALNLLLDGLPREERAARLHDVARYLAPEVLSGSEPTPAADVYAAGRCIEDLLLAAGGPARIERSRTASDA